MPQPSSDAVIRFEPDGYDLDRPWLLGRQVAGHSFLRAAVQGRGEGPIYGYTARPDSAQAFARMVREMDPKAEPHWLDARTPEKIGSTRGVLYIADPAFSEHARLRLRAGPACYSLCGVTHTLASPNAMGELTDVLAEAVMPWDALVCTSEAAVKTVRLVWEAQADYLRWRLGDSVRLTEPQLPVIPLGVHCGDFAFSGDDRNRARTALGLAENEVAILYVGRLVFAGKAHPFPLYHGLQTVAERSGKRLTLILCGRSPNDSIKAAFEAGAAAFAPAVRVIEVDSRSDENRRDAWAAGDVFVSLSDGIQETFGLTPVEAMAAGLPVIVSDWNGYRETVRDGIDGFRIRTWAPSPGEVGDAFAQRQEIGAMHYDAYCWAAASATSVDLDELADRIATLVEQPQLRRRMGAAGRGRARELYDWPGVFKAYQALWGELNAHRLACAGRPELGAGAGPAPTVAPSRLDPFLAFRHFPTGLIGSDTLATLYPGVTFETFRARRRHALFDGVRAPEDLVAPMLDRLARGPATVAQLAEASANASLHWTAIILGGLAKMGLVALSAGPG